MQIKARSPPLPPCFLPVSAMGTLGRAFAGRRLWLHSAALRDASPVRFGSRDALPGGTALVRGLSHRVLGGGVGHGEAAHSAGIPMDQVPAALGISFQRD